MTVSKNKAPLYAMLSIGFISCSVLMYEVLLTRICSLRLFFHFGYLIISNCLLGIGASGTLIFLLQDSWQKRKRFWITVFSVLYFLSLVAVYVFILNFYIPKSAKFSDPSGMIRFFIFNVVVALPFFFAGGAVGILLTSHAEVVNRIYFADLLGAGLGCLLCPLLLGSFGAGGCLIVLLVWGVAGIIAAWPDANRKFAMIGGAILAAILLWQLPSLDRKYPVPGKDALDLTNKATVVFAKTRNVFSKWSVNSRIDVMAARLRMVFCVGDIREHLPPIPDELFISQDGSAGTVLVNFSEHPEALPLIENSMYSLSMRLKQKPRVFIIGVGGGNDIWAAKVNQASYVKAIELNAPILEVHRKVAPHFSRLLLEDPTIHLVCDEGRSALMHEQGKYDVIQLSGIDTWAALASGAYVLAENYLYTKEAILGMYDHLAPDGIIQITRMAADMESLRLIANINAALSERGVERLEYSLMCLRTSEDQLLAAMIKKGRFTNQEIQATEQFAKRNGIEVAYLPLGQTGTLVEQFIKTPDKKEFIRGFPRNITPTTDDEPYFFNFSQWSKPLHSMVYVSEPTQVSVGNPFFLILQLGISVLLSLGLIVLPLLLFRRRGMDWTGGGRTLVFFAGLGLGFIGIEIAAIQKLTLFLGLPIYSLAVSLASLLVFTGLGSLLSTNLFPPNRGRRIWLVPAGIALILMIFVLISKELILLFIGHPLYVRIPLAVLALAPIGLLLGVPFAFGIRLLNSVNPKLIPWAWAINACCTVIGSILSVIISMNFGFYAVLIVSAAVYLVAFAALSRLIPAEAAPDTNAILEPAPETG